MFYDGLLLVAVWLLASAVALMVNGGEPIETDNLINQVWFFVVTFMFFAWFWTHGGQTLGMRAWKIQLVNTAGNSLSWGQSLLRFMTALPAWGLFTFYLVLLVTGMPKDFTLPDPLKLLVRVPNEYGFLISILWIAWDNSRFTWRDRFCQSYVINNRAAKTKKEVGA